MVSRYARACIVYVDGQSLSPLVGTDGGQFESGGARAQRQLQSLVQPARPPERPLAAGPVQVGGGEPGGMGAGVEPLGAFESGPLGQAGIEPGRWPAEQGGSARPTRGQPGAGTTGPAPRFSVEFLSGLRGPGPGAGLAGVRVEGQSKKSKENSGPRAKSVTETEGQALILVLARRARRASGLTLNKLAAKLGFKRAANISMSIPTLPTTNSQRPGGTCARPTRRQNVKWVKGGDLTPTA